jgi:hypothetical protein
MVVPMIGPIVAANTRIKTKRAHYFAAILMAILAATGDEIVAANMRQGRGKLFPASRQTRGNYAATARQSRGNAKCHLPRVCRPVAATVLAVLQKNFRGNTRGKLNFLL